MHNFRNWFNSIFYLSLFLMASQVKSQVVLNYFTGIAAQDKIILEWQMLLGSTCDGIRILHSTDSINFEEIGLIGGLCGSKTESVKYEFTHKTAVPNKINYYQLEFGNTFYSNVIQIELIAFANGYQIRPHPIINQGKILFDGGREPFRLEIVDALGRLVHKEITHSSEFIIHTRDLPDQLLFFRILNEKGIVHAHGQLIVY